MTLALLSWGCGLFPNPGNVQSPRIFKIMGNMSRLTSDALLGFADLSLVNFWVYFLHFLLLLGGHAVGTSIRPPLLGGSNQI